MARRKLSRSLVEQHQEGVKLRTMWARQRRSIYSNSCTERLSCSPLKARTRKGNKLRRMDEEGKQGSWVATVDAILAKFLEVNSACVCLQCKMSKWNVPPFAPFSGQALLVYSTPRHGCSTLVSIALHQKHACV